MKRVLSLIMVLALVLSMVPAVFAADATVVSTGTATAARDSKWTYSYTPAVDGVLTVTVGDGNAAWASDVMNFSDWSNTEDVTGTEEDSYTLEVTGGVTYSIRIFGQGSTSAAISNVPYTITFEASVTEDLGEAIAADTASCVYSNELSQYVPAEIVVTAPENGTMVVKLKAPTNVDAAQEPAWSCEAVTTKYPDRQTADGTYRFDVYNGLEYTIAIGAYDLYEDDNTVPRFISGDVAYEIYFVAGEVELQEYVVYGHIPMDEEVNDAMILEYEVVGESRDYEPTSIYSGEDVVDASEEYVVAVDPTAKVTIFAFEPARDANGVYKFTAPEGYTLTYWGEQSALPVLQEKDADLADNVIYATVKNGCWNLCKPVVDTLGTPSDDETEWYWLWSSSQMLIGVAGDSGDVTLTIEKTEALPTVAAASETETVTYENVHTFPEGFNNLDANATLVNVDVTEAHTAVKGEDGYYHLDGADGAILYVDTETAYCSLSTLIQGLHMNTTYTDSEGNTVKAELKTAMGEYVSNVDANGIYPLTEDLEIFLKYYGWQDVSNMPYGDDADEDTKWMALCYYAEGTAEEEKNELTIGQNEIAVPAEGVTYTWTAAEAGTFTLTIDSFVAEGGYEIYVYKNGEEVALLEPAEVAVASEEADVTIEVAVGDVITVDAKTVYGDYEYAAGTVNMTTTFTAAAAAGSLENPYAYETVDALIADWQGRTIDAGATVYVSAPLGGETLTVTSDTTAACLTTTMGAGLAYDSEAYTFSEADGFTAGQVIIIGIYNQNPSGAAVVTLAVPAESDTAGNGTLDDPYVYESVDALVADWQGRTIDAGATVYVSAPLGGETLTVTSNSTAACLTTTMGAGLAYEGEAYTFSEADGFTAGQVITIGIYNQDPYNSTAATLTAGSSDSEGGETEVTYTDLTIGYNNVEAADVNFKYTATEAGTLTLSVSGFVMGDNMVIAYAVNGAAAQTLAANSSVDLTLAVDDVVTIQVTNAGYTTITAAWAAAVAEIEYTDLTIGYNNVEAADVNYKYTATAAGTLTLTTGGFLMGDNMVIAYAVNGAAAQTLAANSSVDLTLAVGDVVTIQVTDAGYVTITAAWSGESSGEEEETDVLVLGENKVELADGLEGGTWTYTPEADGTLTVAVTAVAVYDAEAGEYVDNTQGLVYANYWNTNFTMSAGDVGAESASVDVAVTANTPVTISFANKMGTATNATLTLSMATGDVEEVEPDGSENAPWIIESLPETITGTATDDTGVFYKYVVTEEGKIVLTKNESNAAIITVKLNGETVDASEGVTVAVNDVLVINPWALSGEAAYDVTIAYATEEEEPTEPDGTEENPYILEELYTTVNAVVEGEYGGSVYYKYVAGEGESGALLAEYPDSVYVYYYINGEYVSTYENVPTYTEGDEIVIELMAWSAGTYELKVYDPTVAKIGDAIYTDLSTALEAAGAVATAENPVTVTMVADAAETYAIITPYVTLDLGTYTLTADYVIGLNGSCVTGTTISGDGKTGGKLIVPKDNVSLSANAATSGAYAIMPVWLPDAECYVLSLFGIAKYKDATVNESGEMSLEFKHQASGYVYNNYMTESASDSGISVIVRAEWTKDGANMSQEFVYTDAMVDEVSTNNSSVYTAAMSGCNSKENFDVKLMIKTDCGVVLVIDA